MAAVTICRDFGAPQNLFATNCAGTLLVLQVSLELTGSLMGNQASESCRGAGRWAGLSEEGAGGFPHCPGSSSHNSSFSFFFLRGF